MYADDFGDKEKERLVDGITIKMETTKEDKKEGISCDCNKDIYIC